MEVISSLCVKWSGKEYTIDLTESTSVGELKSAIQKQTGVLPERQKLLNLKFKGKPPGDDCKVGQLKLKPGFKVMMMGSLEEDISEVVKAPEDIPEVVNDLDIEDEVDVPYEQKEIYLAKVEKRIKDYKIEILNEPRPGKKLLVLDIDYTLFDHRSSAESCAELMRPYLHEFLYAAYDHYDIVIWSATNMKWIKEKMRLLGVSTSENYKIAFYLDHLAMISVEIPGRGVVDVKPLGVIWGKFKGQYTPQNTIMFDDIRRNFLMNPKNGLRIKPFRKAHFNRSKDCELLCLGQYLADLAEHCDDFTSVDHRHWEDYDPGKRT